MARKPSGPPPKSKRPVSTTPKMAPAKLAVAAGPVATADAPAAPRRRTSIVEFANQVRAEARKTTWTSWRETWITSMMVFMMVFITAIFFLIVDQVMSLGMQFLLRLAS